MAMTTTLLDLINANLLQPGNKVMVRDIEGELTAQGTIISNTDRGTVEYKTPTAFSKAVTNSTSGGWQQVKLKSSGGSTSLFDVKRKYAGYSSRKKREKMQKREHTPVHHTSHADHFPHEEGAIRVGLNSITLPILVRFRDDDTKRGKINRVSEDFSTFELEYKGKVFKSVSSASREMYREYADDTGEVVSVNSNGFEDLKYQTPQGEWCKLRELFPVEIRKKYVNISQPIVYTTSSESTSRHSYHGHMDDDDEDEDDVMGSGGSESDSPHSPSSPPSPPPRSTTISKHNKHSIPPSESPSSVIHPIKTPHSPATFSSASPSSTKPIILSLKSPSTPPAYYSHNHPHSHHSSHSNSHSHSHHSSHSHSHHSHSSHSHSHSSHSHSSHSSSSSSSHSKKHPREIELLVHVDSPDSIPYEVTGVADGYESLRMRIADAIPDYASMYTHEMGIYSEYWEKHAGIAFVKPPKSWSDFPTCTTVLLKRVPEQIMISQYDV